MTRLVAAVRRAVGGGRFVSVWSLLAALLLSPTLMAPTTGGPPLALLVAGILTWAAMAAALGLLAVIERALRTPAARAGVVLAVVAVVAAARPLVQDAWLRAVDLVPPPGWQLPSRIATNVVTWLVVFTTIAVIVDALRSLRETNALLRVAAGALADAGDEAREYRAQARDAVRLRAAEVERGLDGLASGGGAEAPTIDARAFAADVVRPAGHALAELAAAEPPTSWRAPASPPLTERSPRPLSAPHLRAPRLRVAPRGIVTVLYLACLLPYAVRATSGGALITGAAVAVIGGALMDAVCRLRRVRRRVAVFLAGAVGCGGALSLIAAASGAPPLQAAVPAIVYTLIALAMAACAGAIHALQVDQHRLSGVIAAEQRTARAGTRPAREALRAASELLHRDGQGRCTAFALEHPRPTASQTDALVTELRGLLVRVRGVFDAPARSDAVSLDPLLATWSRIIDLRAHIDPAARALLEAGATAAQDAYDVAAEGILNAVKHSGERRAEVLLDVVATGAGPALRVRVRSSAPLSAGAELRPASHVRSLGATLRSTSEGAVLEALIRVDAPARDGSVVSAEHPV